jgi:D-lactate dehydrogenase (cytochrome)
VSCRTFPRVTKLDLRVAPTLWLEFHGTEASVAEQAKMVQMIASEHGGTDFTWTTNTEDRGKLWRARHDVVYADNALREGGQLWVTDVYVPVSRLAECITQTQKDSAGSFLPAPIVGHAGDNNFHVGFVLNPGDPKEMAEAGRLTERLVHRALSLDGTCTGEHGIGCGKMDFLVAEHGEAVKVMRAIKQAIDTDNIMNPGKILRIYARRLSLHVFLCQKSFPNRNARRRNEYAPIWSYVCDRANTSKTAN